MSSDSSQSNPDYNQEGYNEDFTTEDANEGYWLGEEE